MEELENIKSELEDLREKLNNLIYKKRDLINPQVVQLSQSLDIVINRFNKVKNNNNSNGFDLKRNN